MLPRFRVPGSASRPRRRGSWKTACPPSWRGLPRSTLFVLEFKEQTWPNSNGIQATVETRIPASAVFAWAPLQHLGRNLRRQGTPHSRDAGEAGATRGRGVACHGVGHKALGRDVIIIILFYSNFKVFFRSTCVRTPWPRLDRSVVRSHPNVSSSAPAPL